MTETQNTHPTDPKRPYVSSTVFYRIDTINGEEVLSIRSCPLIVSLAPHETLGTPLLAEHPKHLEWYKRLRLVPDAVDRPIASDIRWLPWIESIIMELIKGGGRFYAKQWLVDGYDGGTGAFVTVKCTRKSKGVLQVVQQWFTPDEAHPEEPCDLMEVRHDIANMLGGAAETLLNPLDT